MTMSPDLADIKHDYGIPSFLLRELKRRNALPLAPLSFNDYLHLQFARQYVIIQVPNGLNGLPPDRLTQTSIELLGPDPATGVRAELVRRK